VIGPETLVVFVIRTAANPLKSRPSRPLLISVLAIVTIATVLPYTPLGALLRSTPLPSSLLAVIAFLAVTYLFVVQAAKSRFVAGTRCFNGTGSGRPKTWVASAHGHSRHGSEQPPNA
jgi:Mg2+-importing ATPase